MGKAVQRLYHGTSLVQYENLRRGGFVVRDLYVGDSRENITGHYAFDRAKIDDSYAVTLVLDPRHIPSLTDDEHGQDSNVFVRKVSSISAGRWARPWWRRWPTIPTRTGKSGCRRSEEHTSELQSLMRTT